MKATNNSEAQIINTFCCGPRSSWWSLKPAFSSPSKKYSYADPKLKADFLNVASSPCVSFYHHLWTSWQSYL